MIRRRSILAKMIILVTNKVRIRKNGANHFRQLVPVCKSSDIGINNTHIKFNSFADLEVKKFSKSDHFCRNSVTLKKYSCSWDTLYIQESFENQRTFQYHEASLYLDAIPYVNFN